MATNNMVKNITSVYKTPIEINTKCVFTNTTPISAYRGAGRPEANYYMERLIETAAQELGIDSLKPPNKPCDSRTNPLHSTIRANLR